MGLFGGSGGGTTSSMKRPDYINNMINDLNGQVNNMQTPTWQNQQYAGQNAYQTGALGSLANNTQLQDYSNQLMNAGQQGIGQLSDIGNQINGAYSNAITSDSINNLANKLYNKDDVDAAIKASNYGTEQQLATATNPAAAQQTMQQSGFGSSARLAKDNAARGALAEEQGNASDITNNAYNNAVQQAQGILSGNRQNELSALSGLSQNAAQQAGLYNTGAQAAQQNYNGMLGAAQQNYQNNQGSLDMAYNNAIGAQNMANANIQNQLNAASVFNGALGQKTTTTVSGGGSGMLGGAMSGAAAGSAFGPWGALAGAAIGSASSS